MKCLICKADSMVSDRSTYFAQLPDCYVIIENVPCKKCTQCGEVVYSASVMEKIDDLLKTVWEYEYSGDADCYLQPAAAQDFHHQ